VKTAKNGTGGLRAGKRCQRRPWLRRALTTPPPPRRLCASTASGQTRQPRRRVRCRCWCRRLCHAARRVVEHKGVPSPSCSLVAVRRSAFDVCTYVPHRTGGIPRTSRAHRQQCCGVGLSAALQYTLGRYALFPLRLVRSDRYRRGRVDAHEATPGARPMYTFCVLAGMASLTQCQATRYHVMHTLCCAASAGGTEFSERAERAFWAGGCSRAAVRRSKRLFLDSSTAGFSRGVPGVVVCYAVRRDSSPPSSSVSDKRGSARSPSACVATSFRMPSLLMLNAALCLASNIRCMR
jgi:hypothetical protein